MSDETTDVLNADDSWDSTAHGPVRPPLDRATLPLLDLITRQSLDEDYQHVAERRGAEARARGAEAAAPRDRTRTALTVAVVLVFGLLVAVAAVQTSRNASVNNASKDQLIERITARRASVAHEQKQIGALRSANTADESTYGDIVRRLSGISATERTLAARTGWGAVSGDGVRAVLDDAPSGGDGKVRDSDIAGLVNGLFQAGARAVSVNRQRVTALSALRNSGTVVRINDISLSPPYTVLAVGDERTMQARFAQSTSGIRLQDLTRQFGMSFTMHDEKGITVPAASASMLALRHARAMVRVTPDE